MLNASRDVSVPRGEKPLARAAVAAVVVALAVPALAAAGKTTHYSGTFANETGKVSFKLKRSHGERSVVAWAWENLPLMCAGKPRETSGYFTRDRKPLPVKNRKFAGRAVRLDHGNVIAKAKVAGEFAKGYKSADGVFRVTGVIPEGGEDCDSGLARWTAMEAITPVR